MIDALIAYPGGEAQKAELVAEIDRHAAADKLLQGYGYWADGKGCSVGCALASLGYADTPNDHALLGRVTGYGEEIELLNDRIFENLPREEAVLWPARFKRAARPGADLALVAFNFKAFVVRQALENPEAASVKKACWPVVVLLERASVGDMPTDEEWSAAESAAESAAWSAAWSAADSAARSAADSVAWSAADSVAWSAADSVAWSAAESAAWSAESAAWSAESAARSAESAAWSAERSAADSVAWSAAESAAWTKYAAKLLELIENAPMAEIRG